MFSGEVERRVRGLKKGEKIAIYPLSTRYSDPITAYARKCSPQFGGGGETDYPMIEMPEPFQAYFEDYDGTEITFRTDNEWCLKMSVADLKDVISLR